MRSYRRAGEACAWKAACLAALVFASGCDDSGPPRLTLSGAKDISVDQIITLGARTRNAGAAPSYSWSVDDPAVVMLGTPGADYVQTRGLTVGTVTVTLDDTANGLSDSATFSVTASTGGLAGSSWPRARADNGNSGQCAVVGGGAAKAANSPRPPGKTKGGGGVGGKAPQAKFLWACNIGGPASCSTPTVGSDGTVYVIRDSDGAVCAVASDGSSVNWVATPSTFPGYQTCTVGTLGGNDRLYATEPFYSGAEISEWHIYCLDPVDGSQVWGPYGTGAPGAEMSCPEVAIGDDGTLYLGGAGGELHAVDPADGSSKWTSPLPLGKSIVGAVALGPDGTIYAGGTDGADKAAIWAVEDLGDGGNVRWTFHPTGVIDECETPAIVGPGGRVYAHAMNPLDYRGYLYCLDPSKGSVIYRHVGAGPSQGTAVSENMAAPNGTVYDSVHFLEAIKPDGTLDWRLRCNAVRPPVILHNGSVAVALVDGRVVGFNHAGVPVWQFVSGGETTALAVQSDGTTAGTVIYFGSQDGHLYAICPAGATVPCIVASPAERVFFGSTTTGATAESPIWITNAGYGTLDWSVAVGNYSWDGAGPAPVDWLTVTPSLGASEAGIWDEVALEATCPGAASAGDTLEADLVITDAGADNSPKTIHVTFQVGKDYYVDGNTGADWYDGSSPTVDGGGVGPWQTISRATDLFQAVAANNPGDVVHVAPGIYSEATNGETLPRMIEDGVSVIGDPVDPSQVVVDGGGTSSGAECQVELPVLVKGITFRNCSATDPYHGGALTGQLILRSCVFESNTCSTFGGAVALEGGSGVTEGEISDCVFRNNSASDGGGALGLWGSVTRTTRIVRCTFEGNYTDDASEDAVEAGGGAIYSTAATLIEDCVFSGNENKNAATGRRGAAVMVSGDGRTVMKNCLFLNNTGAAVTVNAVAMAAMRNCTVTGNTVGVQSVSIRPAEYPDLAPLEVLDSIVWGNGDDVKSIDPAWDWITYSCVGEAAFDGVGDCISADPLFVSSGGNDCYLDQSSSPCVDAGSETAADAGLDDRTTAADQTLDAATVDIGYHYPVCVTLSVTVTPAGAGTVGPGDGTRHPQGSTVALTATANPGYAFDRWEGDLTGSGNPSSLLMDADKSVTAVFITAYQLSVTTTPAGAGAVSPGDGTWHAQGSTVSLAATPEAGYVFDRWEGDLSGSANPCDLLMDSDKTVTAVFVAGYGLSVSVMPDGAGTVTPGDGTWHIAGSTVTLTATPNAGYVFDRWELDLMSTTNPESLLMDSDKNVTAVFVTVCRLSVTISPAGAGTVSPGDGTMYPQWSDITVTATANAGYTFHHWEGDLFGSMNSEYLFMDMDKAVTAVFAPDGYCLLSVTILPEGAGTVDPADGNWHLQGSTIPVTATPNAGYTFHEWEGALSGSTATESLLMDTDRSVTATFSGPPVVELMQGVGTGGTYWINFTIGDTTGDPADVDCFYDAGSGWTPCAALVSCSSPGSTVDAGTRILGVLTGPRPGIMWQVEWDTLAEPGLGAGFSGFVQFRMVPSDKDGAGSEAVTSFLVDSAVNDPVCQLSVTISPAGAGVVAPGDGTWHPQMSEITLTAMPNAGYTFHRWEGGPIMDIGGGVGVTWMEMDTSVTAVFRQDGYCLLSVNISPPGAGTVDPADGTFHLQDSTISVNATPNAGYTFHHWEGNLTGTTNPESLLMDVDKWAMAFFDGPPSVMFMPPMGMGGTVTFDFEVTDAASDPADVQCLYDAAGSGWTPCEALVSCSSPGSTVEPGWIRNVQTGPMPPPMWQLQWDTLAEPGLGAGFSGNVEFKMIGSDDDGTGAECVMPFWIDNP